MSRMSQLHADVMDAIEQGMSAKFLVAVFGISFEEAESLIQDRMNEEMLKQYEMQQYSQELENFDNFNI